MSRLLLSIFGNNPLQATLTRSNLFCLSGPEPEFKFGFRVKPGKTEDYGLYNGLHSEENTSS
jgi:hypothetical protein